MKKTLIGLLLIMGMTSVSQAGKIDEFEKSCAGGNGKSCATVGAVYAGYAGKGSVKVDMQKAKLFWKKGCELNNGSACTTYAMVLGNEEERIKTMKKACDLGNENGCLAYERMRSIKTLQKKCLNNDIKSCSRLGGELFVSGDYKQGKALLEEICKMGDAPSCSDVKKIDALKELRKLSFAEELSKKCTEEKDKYACEKLGGFLVEVNSFVTHSLTTKEEKKEATSEVMMNMLMAQVYIKEACKLGRKEACRTLKGFESAMRGASGKSK